MVTSWLARTPVAVAALVVGLLVPLLPTGAVAAAPQELTEQASRVDGSNYLVGSVTPDGVERLVRYQRRWCSSCAWKPYDVVRTGSDGRFRIRIDFPRTARPTWRYRGYVAATATHARTEGRVWLACARETCRR